MRCELPSCSNPATVRVVALPTPTHPRGRVWRLCQLCRGLMDDTEIAKERTL